MAKWERFADSMVLGPEEGAGLAGMRALMADSYSPEWF